MKPESPSRKGGNLYDKYTTRNPLYRHLMKNFMRSLGELASVISNNVNSISEIGCGEGYIAAYLESLRIAPLRACDFSDSVIKRARECNPGSAIEYYTRSIYDLAASDRADLLVCCEVLEHLEDPAAGLRKLRETTNRYCILSVPREPVWRALNMMRGKYLSRWGNTPGHVNHWSFGEFRELVAAHFTVIDMRKPFPWSMALCER